MEQFCPDWASAPGDTIRDILAERGVSISEFAQLVDQTPREANDLLEGRATITLGVARLLERTLGPSVEFWMSRDFQYRDDVARIHATENEWLAQLPIGDMIRFGWINPIPHPSDEAVAFLNFFAVPTVPAWQHKYADLQQMALFRTSKSFDSNPAAVAAWIRKGEIESDTIPCDPWNPERFKASLREIRLLTRKKDPAHFIPELQRICAESGVAVVIIRSPSGCRASGATCFLPGHKALLLLSFRYLSDDQFWFTFFHEAGHLLLHSELGFFVEGMDAAETKEEKEANEFAESALVPPEKTRALLNLPVSSNAVIRFAREIGISPGIVVGQLQHHKRIGFHQMNDLKRRYTWAD